jgi:hypothetical protein
MEGNTRPQVPGEGLGQHAEMEHTKVVRLAEPPAKEETL